jgi:hypothetical protein
MNEITPVSNYEIAINITLDGCASPKTMRAYKRALSNFFSWMDGRNAPLRFQTIYSAIGSQKQGTPARAFSGNGDRRKKAGQSGRDQGHD